MAPIARLESMYYYVSELVKSDCYLIRKCYKNVVHKDFNYGE